MKKLINQDLKELNKDFFRIFLESLNFLRDNTKIMIGLSGGSSVLSFYFYIKDNYLEIPENTRKKIFYCFLDERVVPLDNIDSNYKLLKDNFFDELIRNNYLKEENIIKIDINSKNIAKDYFSKVKHINLGLFGVGPDGHTCSLFPNHKLLDNESDGYLPINNSPKPPLSRITISKNMLKKINYSFLFFIGEGKKQAYHDFLDNSLSYKKTPTKLIIESENSFLISDIV